MDKWIIDTERDYIAYSEGIYYKLNNAIVYRIPKRELVLRNTWTGAEKLLAQDINKTQALKLMREFIKNNPERIR